MRVQDIAWLPLVLLLAGCPRPLWIPDRDLKEYVSEKDLVGQWRLTAESLALLTRDGFRQEESHQYVITLLEDGTCRFQSALEEIGRAAFYQETTGRWKLEHDYDGRKNLLSLQLESVKGRGYNTGLGLAKKNRAMALYTSYGDPDSWKFIGYTKSAEQAAPGNTGSRPRP